MPPEGSGDILIVLDEVISEQDFEATYLGGSIGRLLTDILKRAGLKSEDVTITCSSACLGGSDNGKSTSALLKQRIFNSIIVLGNDGFGLLCRKSGIKDKRGQSFPIHKDHGIDANVLIWPTYGLGLVRRVPNYRNIVVADIMRAVGQNRIAEEITWEYWTGQ